MIVRSAAAYGDTQTGEVRFWNGQDWELAAADRAARWWQTHQCGRAVSLARSSAVEQMERAARKPGSIFATLGI